MTYSASATELKQNLSYYLSLVSDGMVSITKNGKTVALLVGPEIRKEIAMKSLKGILSDETVSPEDRLEKYL